MTGPDHYRLAEELLREARQTYDETDGQRDRRLAIAQIHATLALAAATALADDGLEVREWRGAAGTAIGGVDPPPPMH